MTVAVNTMDRTCEHQGSHKENTNLENTCTENQEMLKFLGYFEEGWLGKLNAHKKYCGKK